MKESKSTDKVRSSDKDRSNGAEQTELAQLVARITAASRLLNNAASEATRKIEALEQTLLDAEPGVSVWGATLLVEKASFQRDEATAEAAQRVVTLGFTRVKKEKWGIAVRDELKARKGFTLDEDVQLLRKADRNLRILALPHLEDLARQVLAALEAQLGVIEAARGTAQRAPAPTIEAELQTASASA